MDDKVFEYCGIAHRWVREDDVARWRRAGWYPAPAAEAERMGLKLMPPGARIISVGGLVLMCDLSDVFRTLKDNLGPRTLH